MNPLAQVNFDNYTRAGDAAVMALCVVVAILVLNLLSALLPAWLSLRKPIVESMMEKR